MTREAGEDLVIRAPAKVNLTLHILGKRRDGYHDLDSVMQKVGLYDTLHLKLTQHPGVTLSCPDSHLPEDSSNLVWKAAAAFLQVAGVEGDCGVSMVLEKRIPVAAGLGGGSSDAGAVLTGLDRLLGTGLSEDVLINIGRSLGADVPFFVVPHAAVQAMGVGDRMRPVTPLSDCSLLLVNPGFSVSTAWVYENFTLTRAGKDSKLCSSHKIISSDGTSCPLFNDLETVTIGRYPELAAIKRFLLDNGASAALMSGSGPTLFGIFPDHSGGSHDAVKRCAEELEKKYGQGVYVTRPVESSYRE